MNQNKPSSGQWAEQQRKGMKKQQDAEKQNRQQSAENPDSENQHQQGGAGAPQTTKLEPERQGGIGGP
jgi:hypothetical protein